MIYFTIVFLCTAGLFLVLLEDRFRIWTTVGATAGVYVLSLLIAFLLRRRIDDPVLAEQLPCAVGCLLFFLSSLVLYTNNILQKFFVALLSLCNFTFLGFFLPLLLGLMPFPTAGAFAGFFSVIVTLLFALLMGLLLYRPIRLYSERGVSGFLIGMCLILLALYVLCLGKFDFLFRTNLFAARLLCAALLYAAVIFGFRSLYHAGRFQRRSALEEARQHMLTMESGDFADMLTGVKEVRSARKSGEYALDAITVMLTDGAADQVPAYIASVKRSDPPAILATYHENPYLNATIATKAAFAAQNDIAFECNVSIGSVPLKTAELCVIVNEMLTRACQDAFAFEGERKLRFTVMPGQDTLRFEAVYSARLPEREKFTLRGKKVRDVAQWLFDDVPEPDANLKGLENTREIIGRFSGQLSISAAAREEVILQASLQF